MFKRKTSVTVLKNIGTNLNPRGEKIDNWVEVITKQAEVFNGVIEDDFTLRRDTQTSHVTVYFVRGEFLMEVSNYRLLIKGKLWDIDTVYALNSTGLPWHQITKITAKSVKG